jgi:hypothetical protein
MALESLRKELIDEYDRRLLVYVEREEINNKLLAEKERSINQREMESRQLMQREIDELRSRDQMLTRKVELESQVRIRESQSITWLGVLLLCLLSLLPCPHSHFC